MTPGNPKIQERTDLLEPNDLLTTYEISLSHLIFRHCHVYLPFSFAVYENLMWLQFRDGYNSCRQHLLDQPFIDEMSLQLAVILQEGLTIHLNITFSYRCRQQILWHSGGSNSLQRRKGKQEAVQHQVYQ